MVNLKNPEWDAIFSALSDSTRRQILSNIAQTNPSVAELAAPFDISGPAISKHLKILETSGLLTRLKEGKTHRFRLNPEPLRKAETVINQLATFWTQRLDNLETYLSETENNTQSNTKK